MHDLVQYTFNDLPSCQGGQLHSTDAMGSTCDWLAPMNRWLDCTMSMHVNGSGSLDWNASLPPSASSWSWNDKHVELVTGNSIYDIIIMSFSHTAPHIWLARAVGKIPSKPPSQWLRSTRFEQSTHCTADIFPSPKEVASYCVTEDGSSWADALTIDLD